MRRRAAVAATALVAISTLACGSAPLGRGPAPGACSTLDVKATHLTLANTDRPTAGFALPSGTQPVGIIRDRDGVSVWILGTGNNTVLHVMPDGSATSYPLPLSGLGIQLAQGTDGVVWVPEQYRDAIVAIGPEGQVTECRLPGKNLEPQSTSVASDGTGVWVAEGRGGAIAQLVWPKREFNVFTIGQPGVRAAEVLADPAGGAWFTVMGAAFLGRVTADGKVDRIPLGGSGTYLGLLLAPDGSVWVADFEGDAVYRVATDRKVTSWPTPPRSSPQGLALDRQGDLWFTESRSNQIARIRNNTVQKAYDTGQWPDHLAITTDGQVWFTEYYEDRLGRAAVT